MFLCLAVVGCESKKLHGTVVDLVGKPIKGAQVEILGSGFLTTTNDQGAYELDYVPGAFTLKISSKAYLNNASLELNIMEKVRYPVAPLSLGQSFSEFLPMIRIEPGIFMMGSPAGEDGRYDGETQHRVTITKPYLLAKTELTQGQWQAVMGSNPSHFTKCGADCPVEQVSWDDAIEFLNKLSDKEGLSRCYSGSGENIGWLGACSGYRLPTEAEWEYAARAGTTGARHGDLMVVAWYGDNSDGKTHPVGGKQANAWGLYDMLGNVWEWVWDRKAEYLAGDITDPAGPVSGSCRVDRGGGWSGYARDCRSAFRDDGDPGGRSAALGFRPARSVGH